MDPTQFVLTTIESGHTNRLNFRYGSIPIWPEVYRGPVHNAIRTGRINVTVNDSCSYCNGFYEISSPPGEIANFAVPPSVETGRDSPANRGTVMHEATHVAQDYMRLSSSSPREAEGCAYLAGWIIKILWGYPRLNERVERPSNAFARYLATQFLAGAYVYIIPQNEVNQLNGMVLTANASRYEFNGW